MAVMDLPLVFSDDMAMSAVDWLYFAIWVVVDSLNMLMGINILRSVLRRARAARQRRKCQHLLELSPVALVVPCYLPNEERIIFDTIDWIVDEVAYGGDLTLHVVYNAPKPMPLVEAKLRSMDGTVRGKNARLVRVHRCDGSRSKAENLNYVIFEVLSRERAAADVEAAADGFLRGGSPAPSPAPAPVAAPAASREPVADYVAIFDADHFPDRDCLETLMAFLLQRSADCVQGSTYIRNTAWGNHASARRCGPCGRPLAWLLANFIDAEFFVTYFCWLPAIELIGKTGLFGGSVALWRFEAISKYAFSTEMQTEDINCSAQHVLDRSKIRFCPEARSGELSPASVRAFWRQRQRWAIGWDQVSMRYFRAISKSALSCREKAGLYYVFPGRWLACSIGLMAGVVHPVIAAVYAGQPWGPWLNAALLFGFAFYMLSTLLVLGQAIVYRGPKAWLFITVFYVAGPLYVLFQASLVTQSVVRIMLGRDKGWVVTQRATFSPHARSGMGHGAAFAGKGGAGPAGDGDGTDGPAGVPPIVAMGLSRYNTPNRTDTYEGDLSLAGGPGSGGASPAGPAGAGPGAGARAGNGYARMQ